MIAELFQTTVPNINQHLKAIYDEGELSPEERAEYDTYVSAGTFVSILQAKARTVLSTRSRT